MFKMLKKERESLNLFTENIDDDTLKKRVDHILNLYVSKATFYKELYYVLSVVLVVINAVIPIINQIGWRYSSLSVSIISSIAAIITSVITLYSMKDTWYRYRSSVELMKKECMYYNMKIGDYKDDFRKEIFIQRFEDIIKEERDLWKEIKFNNKEDGQTG